MVVEWAYSNSDDIDSGHPVDTRGVTSVTFIQQWRAFAYKTAPFSSSDEWKATRNHCGHKIHSNFNDINFEEENQQNVWRTIRRIIPPISTAIFPLMKETDQRKLFQQRTNRRNFPPNSILWHTIRRNFPRHKEINKSKLFLWHTIRRNFPPNSI